MSQLSSFSSRSLSRPLASAFLALVLLLATGSSLRASPPPTRPSAPPAPASAALQTVPAVPVAGLFNFKVGTSNRTTVVRVAAVVMVLALFLIIRSTKY
jgi:hypothetical protein